MDSFFARNRLSAYLDRTLPKTEAEAIAEAIARDIALSADVQAMQKTLSLMHTCGRAPAPTGFNARTMATISSQPVPGSQVAWLQRRMARMPTEFLALAGAAVIVLVAINGAGDGSDPRATASQAAVEAPQPQTDAEAEPAGEPQDTGAPPITEGTRDPSTTRDNAPTPTVPKSEKARTPVPSSLPYDPASPLSYRILHGGDQVLYDIAVLADETGGRLVDVHGKLFTPHSLNESRSFSQLYLITTVDEAAKAHAKLIERSGMEPYAITGPRPPLGEGETVFLIEAQL